MTRKIKASFFAPDYLEDNRERRLNGLPLQDNRERRLDAATEDATDEKCLLSFWKDTVLASQASSVTRLNGLLVKVGLSGI